VSTQLDLPVSPANIPTAPRALAFMLAGNATFTLRSTKTGTRFTYNVKRVCCDQCKRDYSGRKVQSCSKCDCHNKPAKYFVSLLTGPDNTSDYSYMGMLVPTNPDYLEQNLYSFVRTRNSRHTEDTPSVKAFTWTLNHLTNGQGAMPEGVEVWHAGKCGKCGRKLTVPSSIAIGIGPECLAKEGL
jgi:Family of unknown function (DUF6011)